MISFISVYVINHYSIIIIITS